LSKLWGRKYKIIISDKKTGKGWDVSNLRCVFSTTKITLQVLNLSIVHVFNLSPATESSIIKEGNRLTIEAGYDGEVTNNADGTTTVKESQYGSIYDGDIIQVIRTKDNNLDYDLLLVCMDGEILMNNKFVFKSLAQNSSPRDIVDAVCTEAGIEQGRISGDLNKTKLPRGKVLFGQPRDILRPLAYDNNGTFWIESDKLFLDKFTDVPKDAAIVLTPKTGLIGYPTQTDKGVEIKCLLDPRMKLKGLVKIDNSEVRLYQASVGALITPLDKDGEYQIIQLTHSGDTRGDEWYTSMICVNREGYGVIPLLMIDVQTRPL
jgi:hypothetical protein